MLFLNQGIAFIMDEDEFSSVLNQYQEDDNDLSQFRYFHNKSLYHYYHNKGKGIYCLTNSSDIELEIYKFEAGSLDIASFIPFFVNGKLNVFIQGNRKWPGKKNVSRDYTSENCYVCFADRNMFGTDLFAKPYHSYAELLIENQEKFGEFFPDTFDWDSHIGNFSFSEKE